MGITTQGLVFSTIVTHVKPKPNAEHKSVNGLSVSSLERL